MLDVAVVVAMAEGDDAAVIDDEEDVVGRRCGDFPYSPSPVVTATTTLKTFVLERDADVCSTTTAEIHPPNGTTGQRPTERSFTQH